MPLELETGIGTEVGIEDGTAVEVGMVPKLGRGCERTIVMGLQRHRVRCS